MRSVIEPHALEYAGTMCAAIIRTIRSQNQTGLRPLAENFIQYITTKEYRLAD